MANAFLFLRYESSFFVFFANFAVFFNHKLKNFMWFFCEGKVSHSSAGQELMHPYENPGHVRENISFSFLVLINSSRTNGGCSRALNDFENIIYRRSRKLVMVIACLFNEVRRACCIKCDKKKTEFSGDAWRWKDGWKKHAQIAITIRRPKRRGH